jgi:hypothetical protein
VDESAIGPHGVDRVLDCVGLVKTVDEPSPDNPAKLWDRRPVPHHSTPASATIATDFKRRPSTIAD